jgi:putrescine aminotransferase
VPDILTIGKGFSGGYIPLGAAVVRKHIADSFRAPGRELRSGSTYGGHTVACAATLANIGIIERENLVERAKEMGEYTATCLERLYHHKIVADCRGIGLLRAVELMADPSTRTPFPAHQPVGNFIRDWCYDHGIILRANGSILVLAPALIVTREQIDLIVDHMDRAIAAAIDHFGI